MRLLPSHRDYGDFTSWLQIFFKTKENCGLYDLEDDHFHIHSVQYVTWLMSQHRLWTSFFHLDLSFYQPVSFLIKELKLIGPMFLSITKSVHICHPFDGRVRLFLKIQIVWQYFMKGYIFRSEVNPFHHL